MRRSSASRLAPLTAARPGRKSRTSTSGSRSSRPSPWMSHRLEDRGSRIEGRTTIFDPRSSSRADCNCLHEKDRSGPVSKSLCGENPKERNMKNIEKKIFNFGLCLCLALSNVIAVRAGGAIAGFDITDRQPSPILGQIIAKVIGIKWDVRSIPVQYSINNTLDPIPNPLDPLDPILNLAQAREALQASFDTWNQIPTSFIEMKITGTTANPRFARFDFVNELTFRTRPGFPFRASSPSTSLMKD